MEYWGSEVVKYESMDFCLSSMGASSHHLPSIQPVNLYFDGAKAGLHYSITPTLHYSIAPLLRPSFASLCYRLSIGVYGLGSGPK
jgi:hypothetical protein